MNETIEAVFENGAFHPQVPVDLAEGERVALHIRRTNGSADDLSDIADLLDVEYLEDCRQNRDEAPSLDEVRSILSAFPGSLAERIIEERDER